MILRRIKRSVRADPMEEWCVVLRFTAPLAFFREDMYQHRFFIMPGKPEDFLHLLNVMSVKGPPVTDT